MCFLYRVTDMSVSLQGQGLGLQMGFCTGQGLSPMMQQPTAYAGNTYAGVLAAMPCGNWGLENQHKG